MQQIQTWFSFTLGWLAQAKFGRSGTPQSDHLSSPKESPDSDCLNLGDAVRVEGQHCIAIGEYSDVWPGEYKGHRVAIKVLRGVSPGNEAVIQRLNSRLINEGRLWKQFRHPHVARFYGLYHGLGSMPALVSDFYPGGNVLQYLKKHQGADRLHLIYEIAHGIQYLHGHTPSIVHGDIRGANVLIDMEGHAHLSDYGLASIIEPSEFTSSKTLGNCRWASPELLDPPQESEDDMVSAPFTTQSDVYAFGMTAIEVFTLEQPFNHIRIDSAVIFAVLKGQRPRIPEAIDHEQQITTLLEKCWDEDPCARPSASDIVAELSSRSET